MANATITTYAQDLSNVKLDTQQHTTTGAGTPAATLNYQDDIIFEMAAGAMPGVLVQVAAEFLPTVAGDTVFDLPTVDGARTLLEVFFDDRQLAFIRKDEAWSFDPEWRVTPTARPFGYVLDPEDRTQFSIFPPPKNDGDTIGASTPLGGPFPVGNVGIIYARTDLAFAGSTYRDLFLPMAFEVLSRELAMDSDHRDDEGAKNAHMLAEVFFKLSFPEAT